jgi:hypothetical protein
VLQAVAKRLNAPYWQVVSRRATSHFGIEIGVPFDPAVHAEHQKWVTYSVTKWVLWLNVCRFWENYHGEWYANEMQWFVNIDDRLEDTTPRTYSFVRIVKVGQTLKVKETVSDSITLWC